MDLNLTELANNESNKCTFKGDSFGHAKLFNFALTVTIAIFGLIGNSVVITVNRKIKSPCSTDMYILLLAITDNLLILSVSLFAFRYVYRYLIPAGIMDWYSSVLVTMVGLLLKNFCQCVNTYTIVFLNVDRYIQVKHIVKAKKLCTPKRAVFSFMAIILGSLIFSLPKIVEHSYIFQDPDHYVAMCYGYFYMKNGLGSEYAYKLSYGIITYAAVMYVIPLSLLTFTNITLISILRQRRKWLSGVSSGGVRGNSEKEKLTRNETSAITTLLAVTMVFMVCQIPDVVLQIIWKLAPQKGPTANMFTYQIVIINSSINFIIYSLSSPAFQRRLKKIWQKKNYVTSFTSSSGASQR